MNGKGAGYGGNGGPAGGNGENGQDGYGGGGGSAGVNVYNDEWECGTHGKGGSGCVAIRIHFDFGDLAA